MDYDTARKAMIKKGIIPPGDGGEDEIVHTRVVVSSRDRNTSAYPLPCKYAIQLPKDINVVYAVQLSTTTFPFDAFEINSTNNTFQFSIDGGQTMKLCTIPPGNYSVTGSESRIQDALNHADNSNNFTVTFDDVLETYTFGNSQTDFLLSFQGAYSNAGEVLGFSSSQTHASANRTLVGSNRRNLGLYNDYVILMIDEMDELVSANNAIDQSFAMLYRNQLEKGMDPHAIKQFNPPLAKVSKLNIQIQDLYGNVYAGNQNHTFELVFSHAASTRKNW